MDGNAGVTERTRNGTLHVDSSRAHGYGSLFPQSDSGARRRPSGGEMRSMCLLVALSLLTTAPAAAQQASGFDLTIPNIMRGPEHVGEGPTGIQWSDDGRWIYFRWKPGGRPWHEPMALHRVPARGGEPERLPDAVADTIAPLLTGGTLSDDERWRITSHEGDIYAIDRRTGELRRLTHTRGTLRSPTFSRDGRTIFYVSDNNLYELDRQSGTLRQITDIRSGPAEREPRTAEGQRGFLETQQRELFEHIRVQEERRRAAERRTEMRRAADALQPIHLERDERVASIEIEPGGRLAALSTSRTSGDTRSTVIPFWVTASGYTETREVRTKVGDVPTQDGRIGLIGVPGGDVRWLDLAAALPAGATPRSNAEINARFAAWNRAGSHGLITAISADFKEAWIWVVDAASGGLTLVAHDRDEAWIAGPCSITFCVGWMPDDRAIYFVSERAGHAHLYTVRTDGSGLRQLTSGNWEIERVSISPRRDRFFLHSNEGSPFEAHFYHMNLDGTNRTRITTLPGRNDATWSPDGTRLAIVHSYANRPTELYVAENRPGARATRVTHSPMADWLSYDWIAPEIVMVPADDGVQVPARIYRPEDVGAQPNGAAVIFVHGAGYLQNVHNWWSNYYREYMFHHLLASRGYVVLDLDYRASRGYGRDWRTAIYRHMGGRDLADHVDGSRYLTANFGIEPERIGIYGGSYGGFITLMALFTAPEYFGAGAALRAVTDWAHYNHGYTGRILNLPHADTLAYRQSSPIYFAEGLRDPLLITHGMVDVNVHFSDVVRLAQRLIELGKTDWEMAVYPVEDHAFVEPSSWADQYRRIFELFENNLTAGRTAAAPVGR
jgi:dipeptidyl aminopeptidase/acylaminoacyl peptidase